MIVLFRLTMPTCGSWDGTWSGAKDGHFLFRNIPKTKAASLIHKSWKYSWEDGWTAQITAEPSNCHDKRKLIKKTKGFCGYDWMVDSIIEKGTIIN